MPLHTIIFAASLVGIASIFALKEREVYAGERTALTRACERCSPAIESLWQRALARVRGALASLGMRLRAWVRAVGMRASITARYLVVVVADKMIRAVRGEKLLEMRGAPSMYLKRLREHRDV